MRGKIEFQHFWGNIFHRIEKRKNRETADDLKEIPLFSDLSTRELRIITDIIHLRNYGKDEFIFKKGQPGAAMFIIKSGTVMIQDVAGQGDSKKAIDLVTLTEGAFFGELALLDDSPRSAYARAVVPVEAYALFRADLYKILDATPTISSKIYYSLARIIGERLKKMNAQLFGTGHEHKN